MKHQGIELKNFSESEYRPEELPYMSRNIMYATQKFRTELGARVSPSKAKGAQARFAGRESSEHFVKGDKEKGSIWKYSEASDVFCNCHIFKAWVIAVKSTYIKRVGVYFDTKDNNGKKHPMLHLGLKEDGLLWFRVAKNKYMYSTEPGFENELWKLFVQFRLHREF